MIGIFLKFVYYNSYSTKAAIA